MLHDGLSRLAAEVKLKLSHSVRCGNGEVQAAEVWNFEQCRVANFDLPTTKHAHRNNAHRGCSHPSTIIARSKMATELGLPKLPQLESSFAGLLPQECSNDSDNNG